MLAWVQYVFERRCGMDMKRVLGAVCFSGMITVISLIAAVGLLDMILHIGAIMTIPVQDYHRIIFVGGGTFSLIWAAVAVSVYRHPTSISIWDANL